MDRVSGTYANYNPSKPDEREHIPDAPPEYMQGRNGIHSIDRVAYLRLDLKRPANAIKYLMLSAIYVFLTGCMGPGSNTNKEVMVSVVRDREAPRFPPEDTPFPKPYCLHIKYNNNYFYYYSENYAETWVTDGPCSPEGGRRSLEAIGVAWRYEGQAARSKLCANTDSCSFSERNYGIGRTIFCSSGTATSKGRTTRLSSDPFSC